MAQAQFYKILNVNYDVLRTKGLIGNQILVKSSVGYSNSDMPYRLTYAVVPGDALLGVTCAKPIVFFNHCE